MSDPTLRLISLGAGVQSSTLLMLAAEGGLPDGARVDGAIFADTGWEPAAVYRQLDRLEVEIAKPAGIPVYRVSVGNIRADALNPSHRFASMPLYVSAICRDCDGSGTGGPAALARAAGRCATCRGTGRTEGMARRQCTSEYKLRPVREQTRRLLGATAKANGRPGRVPTGRWAETLIGFSTDEADRAERAQDVGYSRSRFPLLELGMSRDDCTHYLERHGFAGVVKSSCIGCPYRRNPAWRAIRDETPEEWADVVAFDAAIRSGNAHANAKGQELAGSMYLHRSLLPLSEAPIDRVSAAEWAERQGDLLELVIAQHDEANPDDVGGCSPWSCH